MNSKVFQVMEIVRTFNLTSKEKLKLAYNRTFGIALINNNEEIEETSNLLLDEIVKLNNESCKDTVKLKQIRKILFVFELTDEEELYLSGLILAYASFDHLNSDLLSKLKLIDSRLNWHIEHLRGNE